MQIRFQILSAVVFPIKSAMKWGEDACKPSLSNSEILTMILLLTGSQLLLTNFRWCHRCSFPLEEAQQAMEQQKVVGVELNLQVTGMESMWACFFW